MQTPLEGAFRCVWMQNRVFLLMPGGGERKDREQGSRSRQTGQSKGFWDDDETERDGDVTNRSFPPAEAQAQQVEAYFDRESGTVMPTVNEARSLPTAQNAKRSAKQVRVRGRTEHHERE